METTNNTRYFQLIKLVEKPTPKTNAKLWDFICTDHNRHYFFDGVKIYKMIFMYGAKTIVFNTKTGRISTRRTWNCIEKLKGIIIE